jgi:hypothetical protein
LISEILLQLNVTQGVAVSEELFGIVFHQLSSIMVKYEVVTIFLAVLKKSIAEFHLAESLAISDHDEQSFSPRNRDIQSSLVGEKPLLCGCVGS